MIIMILYLKLSTIPRQWLHFDALSVKVSVTIIVFTKISDFKDKVVLIYYSR